jgi:hypothetical protein
MWLAPVLVIAAQAFLLQVLSTENLGWVARSMVLAAGVVATIAALVTLARGRAREVEYSEAIAHYSDALKFPEVRTDLPRKAMPSKPKGWWRPLDGWLRKKALCPLVPAAPIVWGAALLLFIAADIAVYVAA